jgi:hypothetical protein
MDGLRACLAQATDEEVSRLVAMLDEMRDRSALDDLLAALRPRIARLRPERPLRFVRLLFLPLDPLIVPAGLWNAHQPTIPRTALRPLADTVRAMIGEMGVRVDAVIKQATIAGSGFGDAALVACAGSLLWPAAADAIARSTVPADWTARTRLSEADYGVLADNIALVMAQVPRLHSLVAEAEIGMPIRPEALHAMLRAGQPIALAMMVTLILGRLPQALPDLAHPRGLHRDLPRAVEAAKRLLLRRLETGDVIAAAVMGSNAIAAAADVRRMFMLLQMLREEPAHGSGPRVQGLLDRLDEVCLERFKAGLRQDFIRPLELLTPDTGDAEIIRLEEAVRGLGAIAVAGAMIGGNRTYGILVQRMVHAVRTHKPQGPLTRGDRAHLVELLVGPNAAWRMLATSPATGQGNGGAML